MRPRSFYIGFPPALVKVKRKGIEYGIGMIPLGGIVKLPGMNRPAARDLRTFVEPAMREEPSLVPAVGALRRALEAEDYEEARRAGVELEREVGAARADASAQGARRSEALREVEEGTSPEAYWRSATWKRVAVIAAGPLANVAVAFLILFFVFAHQRRSFVHAPAPRSSRSRAGLRRPPRVSSPGTGSSPSTAGAWARSTPRRI